MWNGAPLWRHFYKFFEAVSKQYITTKFFEVKNLIFRHLFKIWKFNNSSDVIKSKLAQKEAEFVYYITTVIKTVIKLWCFSRLVIHFWEQYFKLWYHDPFLIPRSDCILKLGQKRPKFAYLLLLAKKVKKHR